MAGESLSDSSDAEKENELLLYPIFEEVFPFYLSIGMTETQFWDGDVALARHYRKAYKIEVKRREAELWRQGLYFYHAICAAAPALNAFSKKPQPLPYLKEPFATSEEEQKEREERDRKKAYEDWIKILSFSANKARKGENDG